MTTATNTNGTPAKKIDTLRGMMNAGQWADAIKFAAKFPRLPEGQRKAILEGNEAILRPAFQRQLRKDPEAQITAAKAALIEAYTPAPAK